MEPKIEPKIIKILPYRGRNNEVTEGRKTIIKLFKDRIEYSVKYTETVKITLSSDEDAECVDSISYNEEDGCLDKSGVLGVVKYIKTSYTDSLEAYNVNYVDIYSKCNSLTFSLENESDKNKLYKELHEWKYGE